MKELKSKKSGQISVISDEEYAEIVAKDKERVNKKNKLLDAFTVTDLKMRSIIPSLKETPKEVKITKKIKE
jgi:hypothetical protein